MPRPTRSNPRPRQPGFRLGVYVFKDAEVIDYAAPIGVFSEARAGSARSWRTPDVSSPDARPRRYAGSERNRLAALRAGEPSGEETAMFDATPAARNARTPGPPRTLTLLDLVSELVDAGGSEREVAAAVHDLIETGRVRLVGHVREADLAVHV